MFNNAVPNDKENARLYARMKARLEVGEAEQEKLIARVAATVIRDKLVPPSATNFSTNLALGQLLIGYGKEDKLFSIHKHAFTQLVQKVGVPVVYANQLRDGGDWKLDLLSTILNRTYHLTEFNDRGGAPKFLHRIVGTELRGFLSRRFNRHIASAPLLRSFIDTCSVAGAIPLDATASDIKVALKCMLPYIFEPVPGEYVGVGVEWSNSDFGAGRMQVALSLWMPRGDRFTVLDHVISRVHIGSVIEESDIDMSEETSKKEAETQALAIRDSVVGQLSVESVERLLGAVKEAHEAQIPWHQLRGQLSRFLSKKDVESLQELLKEENFDLPEIPKIDGEKVPTKWWASSALSWLANRTDDPEKKLDLQHAAGSYLEVK